LAPPAPPACRPDGVRSRGGADGAGPTGGADGRGCTDGQDVVAGFADRAAASAAAPGLAGDYFLMGVIGSVGDRLGVCSCW
jgi:hypothetical protein